MRAHVLKNPGAFSKADRESVQALYAPAALLHLGADATIQGPLVVYQMTLGADASSTLAADGADSGSGTAGQLLGGDLLVYANDPNGLFSADELARIQDAVNAVDATVEPYGVSVTETTDSTAANVTLIQMTPGATILSTPPAENATEDSTATKIARSYREPLCVLPLSPGWPAVAGHDRLVSS